MPYGIVYKSNICGAPPLRTARFCVFPAWGIISIENECPTGNKTGLSVFSVSIDMNTLTGNAQNYRLKYSSFF
jgi:hypothetical protein